MKPSAFQLFSLSCASLAALTLSATAQRPEGGGDGPPRGEGRGFMRFVPPVTAALDTDKNGELSEEEIKNAATSLKSLDKNSDGKISAEEMRPAMPQREREGDGRPGGGGSPEEMVTRLMAMDKNGDGKLTKDELSERMAGMLTRGDTDRDGALSKEEIRALASAGGGQGRGERREGGEGRRRPEGDRPLPPPPAPPAPPAAPEPPK